MNQKNEHGWTKLCQEAAKGSIVDVKFLLKECKANANLTDNQGWTPLHAAAIHGHTAMAQLLIENGADVDRPDNKGWTPLNCVVNSCVYPGEVEEDYLRECRCPQEDDYLKVARLLIEKGADVNHMPLLCWIAREECSSMSMAKLLIENRADVNLTDNQGQTPLHYAAANDYIAMAKLLTNFSKNILLKLIKGYHWIKSCKIQPLIENGADVNLTDNQGQTPLHYAAANGHIAMAQLLIENGANVNLTDNQGQTPLDYANGEILKLLGNNANVTQPNNDG